jgi:hypothetical protein
MITPEARSYAPKIEVQCHDEVLYWADRLRTTPGDIVDTVERVGDNPRAVATELGVALLD